MLEIQKLVLENVSYDKRLFKKEIIKSFKWLNSNEIGELYEWLNEHYGCTHQLEIQEAFQQIAA